MKELQEKIVAIIVPVFEENIEKRKKFYENNPKPQKTEIDDLISKGANIDAILSAVSGLAPGPYGLLAVLPEIKFSLDNQINMIYDIGVASGKEHLMSKEMVLSLAMQSAAGSLAISSANKLAQKILIRKASVKLFKQLAKTFGIKITASATRSAVTKFVPVLGGMALSAWVRYTTMELGNNTSLILSKDITIEETEDLSVFEHNEPEENLNLMENKVLVLMNLMKSDGNNNEKEKEYITQIIDKIDFSFITKGKLKIDLELSSQSGVDMDMLRQSSKVDKDSLLIDMIALAKRDGVVHYREFSYIMDVCKILQLNEDFVIDHLAANYYAVKYYIQSNGTEINNTIVIPIANGQKKVQFYTNNRLFLFNSNNQVLAKGNYVNGGKKIVFDDGKVVQSHNLSDNLNTL